MERPSEFLWPKVDRSPPVPATKTLVEVHVGHSGYTGEERPPALPERAGSAFQGNVLVKSFQGRHLLHTQDGKREGIVFKNKKVGVSWTLLVK